MEDGKIIEAENLLREHGVPQDAMDEILRMFSEKDVSLQPVNNNDLTEEEIKIRIMDEKDWRKKASLSAMLISKSLTR